MNDRIKCWLGIEVILITESFFLSFDTNSFSSSSSSFGVLSSYFESPFVSKTTIASDLEQSFNILSEFGLKYVRSNLKVLSFLEISLSIEEPSRDTVSFWVID